MDVAKRTMVVDGGLHADEVHYLLDATIEVLAAQKSPRVKEVLRARDEFLRLFFDGTFEQDADNIERYFNQFAVCARRAGHPAARA